MRTAIIILYILKDTLNKIKIYQSKFRNNISIKWSKHYVILTQTENYCYITSAAGQNCVQISNENVIRLFVNVLLEIRYKSVQIHVCSLFLVSPKKSNSGLCCIIFETFQDHTQLDIRTPGMTTLYT